VIDAFRVRNQEVYEAGVYANTYALLLMPLTNVLGNFFVIVLAGLGGWLALQGLVSVGTIATFIAYGQNFIQPLRQLANMYNAIQAALAGAERVFEIMDTPTPETRRCAGCAVAHRDPRRCALRRGGLCLHAARHADHQAHDAAGARRARRSPWWGRPAPARRRSSTCSSRFYENRGWRHHDRRHDIR
jgi:ABC-type multidrug transport system fused ATPase/permease subunit